MEYVVLGVSWLCGYFFGFVFNRLEVSNPMGHVPPRPLPGNKPATTDKQGVKVIHKSV